RGTRHQRGQRPALRDPLEPQGTGAARCLSRDMQDMRQLALDIRLADHAVFDSFHAGSNALAVATLRGMATGERPPAAWIWGLHAAGKSHLLQATVALAHAAGASTAWLPLADLVRMPATLLDGMG